jgi:uncharacterized membrane protein YesL
MHKDLAPAAVMMTAEMRQVFQSDLDLLIRRSALTAWKTLLYAR